MEDVLNILKKNSINEAITASDVADTDEIISAIIDQKFIDSLAYQICDVQPIHGPTGSVFAVNYETKPEVIEVLAVAQVDTIDTITATNAATYTIEINGEAATYVADGTATVSEITLGLTNAINALTGAGAAVSATDNGTSVTLTANNAGIPFTSVVTAGVMTVSNTTPNTEYVAPRAESKNVDVKKTSVYVEDDSTQSTGFTLEAIQDMQSQFGKDYNDFIAKAFGGISNAAENTKLLTKLATWAPASDTTITLDGNAENNVFLISQQVAKTVLKINEKNYRTLDAWCVLPQTAAASFLALGSYFSDDVNESGLFIGKTGRIKYYVNPDPAATVAFVGVKGFAPGNSSVIMSPYQHTIMKATDPDTGNVNMFNVNRYAMTLSPLSDTGNEMIRKFTIA